MRAKQQDAASAAEPNSSTVVDGMVERILRGMIASGAWDVPTCTVGCDCRPFIEKVYATTAAHAAVARRAATESAVLLKNSPPAGAARPALPLRRGMRVGLVGRACYAPPHIDLRTASWMQGDYYVIGGSGRVVASPNRTRSVHQALVAREVDVVLSPNDSVPAALAVAYAGVDVLIACGGATTTEAKDRESLQLDQHQFLHALGANLSATPAAPALITLAMAPGHFDATWAVNSSAAMVMFLGGEGTGEALADLLLGTESPSGKLPLTLPLNASDMVQPCTTANCSYDEG